MVVFSYVLMTLLMFSGLFLIGLVLLQRGRGGGLAGAFGGMGGQSAFGTKAGDVFTRITIGVATAWILLCAGSVVALHHASGTRTADSTFKTDDPKGDAGADTTIKATPKEDAAIGAGKDDPNTPPPAAPQTPAAPQNGVNPAPDAGKPAADAPAAKPEEPKTEAKPNEAAPAAEEKKPEASKAEEPKPADPKPAEEAKKPAEPATEPAPEKKPE